MALIQQAYTDQSSYQDYAKHIEHLNQASLTKSYNAYTDIDWDSPDNAIDHSDPRFIISESRLLARTEWFKSLNQQQQINISLQLITNSMRVGVIFENVLNRGALNFISRLPEGAIEFRYTMHEVIEECQHSLMFQEFINRSKTKAAKIPPWMRVGADQIAKLGFWFPELFFIFVLGGEEPIDYNQRQVLQSNHELHPLVKRIMQIHTTEEARHISFAKSFVAQRVPQLSHTKRHILRSAVPAILGIIAAIMLKPSKTVIRDFAIPDAVIKDTYHDNPEYRRQIQNAFAETTQLCRSVGLIDHRNEFIWRKHGLV